ncbi:MAG TPA: phosphatidate cytidylyltransferase, partial [Pirellulaceae bacterium]|nr:phosphatidate cytidylyltransferase [Pirellulaceae bacterium]
MQGSYEFHRQDLLLGALLDTNAVILLLAVLGILAAFGIAGLVLRKQSRIQVESAIIRTFNNRVLAWLTTCVVLSVTMMFDRWVTVAFFFLLSFWALREFITMTPTRRGDHRTLFWLFVIFTPAQYVLVALDATNIYTVIIPVYASLFIPARIAFTGETKRFLERTAKIQFGLLICVYALSHAPALLYLNLKTWDPTRGEYVAWSASTAGLLLFLVVMVLVSDMLYFVWDRLGGRHVIARDVNASRSWEGLMGAAFGSAFVAIVIQWLIPVTPFQWYTAGIMGLLISVMASSGSMTLSAIKRDRGIKDYG